jgi:hypothetical protein
LNLILTLPSLVGLTLNSTSLISTGSTLGSADCAASKFSIILAFAAFASAICYLTKASI